MFGKKPSTPSLESTARDLIERLESEDIADRSRFVDAYFGQHMQQAEMSGQLVALDQYGNLASLVKQEVLPAYDTHLQRVEEIESNKGVRSLSKYVAYTVLALELAQLVATRGKSLHPGFLIPTLIAEAALGGFLYGIDRIVTDVQKIRSERRMYRTLKRKDEVLQTDARYQSFQQLMDGNAVRAESLSLLHQYDNPEHFWTDYEHAKRTDPRTKREVRLMNTPTFDRFVQLHTKGISSEKIAYRFDELSKLAHSYFLDKN